MGWKIVTATLRFICQVDSTIDWKENQLTKRVKFQSELTEEDLQRLLEEAVKNEDYENASRYRDLLKSRKGE